MMFFNRNRKGQSTLEYAVLIAGIVGAVLIFRPYVQRAVQGRFKESSDRIGYKFGGEAEESITNSMTAWEETGTSGETTETTEIYDAVGTQNITSETDTAQTVTRKEKEEWGSDTPGFVDFSE